MGRPPQTDDEVLDRAARAVRDSEDADSLRAAQATLLPLLGLSLDVTALALGRDRYWVSRARGRFLRGQPAQKRHGGRRHGRVAVDEEVELLRLAIERTRPPFGTRSLRAALRELLDAHGEQPVADSTITEFLNRTAPKLLPGATGTLVSQYAPYIAQEWFLKKQIEAALKRVAAERGPLSYCT